MAGSQENYARIGVDIGGTFTDLVLIDGRGRTWCAKVSSTPAAPERAVIDGVAVGRHLSGGQTVPDVFSHLSRLRRNPIADVFGHGTTATVIAANAVAVIIRHGPLASAASPSAEPREDRLR